MLYCMTHLLESCSTWVELGRVYIVCEVSMISSHSAMPRVGHLDHVLYIFSCLKHYHNSRLVLDRTYPVSSIRDNLE